jgi:hypothetical protein
MDLTSFRPWIILIEATQPLTFATVCEAWEQYLLTSRYEYVHFDGLNRWYIAEERSNLKARFEAPPNVFDRFELAATISLRDDLAAVKHDLEQIRASASWRWTAPFRAARDRFCRLAERLRSWWAFGVWRSRAPLLSRSSGIYVCGRGKMRSHLAPIGRFRYAKEQ